MSESFVDLSYRGLTLGKRIKLTQIRPTTAYLEMPTPMPVGTALGISTDDGVLLEAMVAEVREQVGSAERPPGMVIKPKLEADVARKWWSGHVELQDAKTEKALPTADTDGKVTLKSRRMTGDVAVPELVDDGRNTAVMDAIDDTAVSPDTLVADVPPVRDSSPSLQDDGKRTMMMDAVDLAALGLDPASSSGSMRAVRDSGSMPVASDEDSDPSGGVDTNGGDAGGDKPEGKSKKKRKKR